MTPAVVDLLEAAYAPLLRLAAEVDDDVAWSATRLPGWTVRDLLYHLAMDAQRALVAFGTPAAGPADTDEVTYWSAWSPGGPGAAASLRVTRLMASAPSSVAAVAGLYAETARAVLVLAGRQDPAAVVQTQGRRITVQSLLHTLAVEAGVHHLDLPAAVRADLGGVGPAVLAAVRHVVAGLLAGRGHDLPDGWDDERVTLVGTGREALTAPEREALGVAAEAFPLFG